MSASGRGVLETLGVLSVVASLGFVGYQLKQTNEIARLEAQMAWGAIWQEANLVVATDERLSRLLARVQYDSAGLADFEPEERLALNWVYDGLDHTWEQAFKQLRVGVLKDDDISLLDGNSPFYASRYHREIWPDLRGGFTDEFATFWEERFGLASGGPGR